MAASVLGNYSELGDTLNPRTAILFSHNHNDTFGIDEEKQARLDVDRHFSSNDHVLKFGLRHNERAMDRVSSEWWLSRDANTPASALPHMDTVADYIKFKVRGSSSDVPSRLLTLDRGRTWETFMPGGVLIEGTLVQEFFGASVQQSYGVEEKTGSAWMQMDLLFGQWSLIPGFRYVRTEQISSGFNVINAGQSS